MCVLDPALERREYLSLKDRCAAPASDCDASQSADGRLSYSPSVSFQPAPGNIHYCCGRGKNMKTNSCSVVLENLLESEGGAGKLRKNFFSIPDLTLST